MSQLIDETELRVQALRLSTEIYGHNGADVVVTAAEEFLEFLLDGTDELDEDDVFDEEPVLASNGEPFIAKFLLTEEAVVHLSTLVAVALETGAKWGLGSTPQAEFAENLLAECRSTLQIINKKGARV